MVEKGGILLGRKMAEYYKGGQQNLGREFNRILDRKTKHGTGRVYDRRQDIIWEEGKSIRQKDSKRFRRIAEYIR
jgi:hypothetical protein